MKIATRTPFGLVFAAVACGVAAGVYLIAQNVSAEASAVVAPPPARAESSAPASRPPTAAEFAHGFVGVSNHYARTHGDPVRLARADCVQASPGHYMCSYVTTRPGRRSECHVMQARWTPKSASSFTVTLAGRSRRCGSLREALRSLE
jgi:hypothetical protein